MLSRPALVMVVTWAAWMLILWINDCQELWPADLDLAGLIPFSSGSRYAWWYHAASAALLGSAGWLALWMMRRR